MKFSLQNVEPILLLALGSASQVADDEIGNMFGLIGDKLNDKIEGTETELDDFAKARLVVGLKRLTAELEVDEVDADYGDAADAPA